jgi:hypothetical protein
MPALSFLVFVGLALITLLFYGRATLEPVSPEIVTHHAVAPAPNLTSQVILEPRSAPDALAKIGHVARAARAEANNRPRSIGYERTSFFDRFSIKGY